ncbi:MAG: hypothetical protein JO372_06260 [Solirubrobacterales bacterium]|nr:hypothetical protein [Solirubrobacterales bacterium]
MVAPPSVAFRENAPIQLVFDSSRLHVFDENGVTAVSSGGAENVLRLETAPTH